MSPVLDVGNLHVAYGEIDVVHGIDLHVAEGEVVVLLGANGAGKSSTLKAIAGEIPSRGDVRLFGGALPRSVPARTRAGLAYLPEERGVIRTLTVAENLRLARVDLDEATTISPELRTLANRRAGDLSGGEQQILALTRALATAPQLVIADELSFGLAPIVVDRMLRLAQGAAQRGAGVLLVEQYARKALAVADRAYVMRRGALVLEGSGAELLHDFDAIERSYLHAKSTELNPQPT